MNWYIERVRDWVIERVIGGVAIGVVLAASPAFAKPEYTRKTSKGCAYCHQPPGYNLTEAGKYYADHGYSLKGYKPKPKAGH